MKFDEVHEVVGRVPFISKENARHLYDLILDHRYSRVLELGIAHGTATCYMAAAMHELGRGLVTAVDLLEVATSFEPSAEAQLEALGLSDYADVVRMESGYTWFLHDEIARNTVDGQCAEIYDLCVIDGPKNWTVDGAAFFFVDKLLKKDGWLIFDDYNWTYASVDRNRSVTDGISHRGLSADELRTPHIREVFELLVRQHPDYGNLVLLDGGQWALAQKTTSPNKTYHMQYRQSSRSLAVKAATRLYERFRS